MSLLSVGGNQGVLIERINPALLGWLNGIIGSNFGSDGRTVGEPVAMVSQTVARMISTGTVTREYGEFFTVSIYWRL